MKLRVGMKVKVKNSLCHGVYYGRNRSRLFFNGFEGMDVFRGKTGIITELTGPPESRWFYLNISNKTWTWNSEMVDFLDADKGLDLSHIKPYPIVAFLKGITK